MKSRLVSEISGQRTFVIVIEPGEEAFAALTGFATEQGVDGASLTAIGAFERATVGWFDLDAKTYRKIPVDEQCEVLSAIGDVALGDDGKPSLHVHAVLGAIDFGYRVVLVTDALCSSSDATHDALLTVYHQRFAQQVETVEMETVLSNWT